MAVLTVPNWSFGRSKSLLHRFEDILAAPGLTVHYLQGDLDHNRTVSAFSGPEDSVVAALKLLATEAFDAIDLNRHVGVHPRIGALDVCPFIPLREPGIDKAESERRAEAAVAEFGEWIGSILKAPVFLYERSAKPGKESLLPKLRSGGFGGLIDQELDPDFGPHQVHPRCGAVVLGVRGFLVAMNCDLGTEDPELSQRIAQKIRKKRREGDPMFLGVRALGFPLASAQMSQVSLNFTLPDFTPIDPIVEWVEAEATAAGVPFAGTELIGVIRPRDLEHASRVHPQPSQVVDGCF